MSISNTSWTFQIDHVNTYAYIENFLTKEECEKIIKIGKELNLDLGTVSPENKKNSEIRKSNISWIYPNEDTVWLFRKLVDGITNLNNQFFKFDITGLNEGLQFTNYKAPSGHYQAHTDKGLNTPIRKLSVTIQLSDPLKYEGGDLKLIDDTEPVIAQKKQGMLYVFPSYVLHEVTPVTKGERNSLVAWVAGPNFK